MRQQSNYLWSIIKTGQLAAGTREWPTWRQSGQQVPFSDLLSTDQITQVNPYVNVCLHLSLSEVTVVRHSRCVCLCLSLFHRNLWHGAAQSILIVLCCCGERVLIFHWIEWLFVSVLFLPVQMPVLPLRMCCLFSRSEQSSHGVPLINK